MEDIQFGVRYQPLDLFELLATRTQVQNEEESIFVKHWVLVFTSKSKEVALTLEAMPSNDGKGTICMPFREVPKQPGIFPLGTYHGRWRDLLTVLTAHPQRGSKYSSCFNNCQHFVAIFLLFLDAFANSRSTRKIRIDEPKRRAKLYSVLKKIPGTRVWNAPNHVIGRALFMQVPAAGALAVGTLIAAESTVAATVVSIGIATVTSTVSAGGIGATTTVLAPLMVPVSQTVIVPATCAGFAALCVPFALGLTGVAGIGYISLRASWRKRTSFGNPLICGFQTRDHEPLTIWECSYSSIEQDGKRLPFRHTSVSVADIVSSNISCARSVAPELGVVGVSSLCEARDAAQRSKGTESGSGQGHNIPSMTIHGRAKY